MPAAKRSTKSAKRPSATSAAKKAPKTAKPSSTKAVVLDSKLAFQGKVFRVTTDTVTEPGGITGVRDVVRHNGSIVILAVDASSNPADPTILIERQYRHAAGQFLFELPAGSIDPGEAPLAAAKRELIEETGFRARKWKKLVRYFASPGFLAETMQIFLAEDIRPGVAEPEEDEKIEILHMPLSEVLHAIGQGKVLDGKTLIGVLFYAHYLFKS